MPSRASVGVKEDNLPSHPALDDILSTIRAFAKTQRYGVIASVAEGCTPQAAVVGIAITDELEVIFDTLSATHKYQNFKTNPAGSVVLFEGERTLQIEGRVFEPRGDELLRYQSVYFSAWPECREHLSWPGIAYLVARPDWLRFSDYDQRPPLVRELRLRSAHSTPPEHGPPSRRDRRRR